MTTLGKTRSYFTPCIYTSQKLTKTDRLLHVPSKIHFPLWRGIGTKPNHQTRWVNIKYFSRFWILSFSRVKKQSNAYVYQEGNLEFKSGWGCGSPIPYCRILEGISNWYFWGRSVISWRSLNRYFIGWKAISDSAIQPESFWNPSLGF